MPFQFHQLDSATREFMLEEIQHDIHSGLLYISDRLNEKGRDRWPSLLADSAAEGSDVSLAAAIRQEGLLNETEPRKKPKGGFRTARVPVTAADTLAEGEFNRFYIRAICRRAMSQGNVFVEVIRAKHVENPREGSEGFIGQKLNAEGTLVDLRANPGFDAVLGLPPGPNSGLSVRFG